MIDARAALVRTEGIHCAEQRFHTVRAHQPGVAIQLVQSAARGGGFGKRCQQKDFRAGQTGQFLHALQQVLKRRFGQQHIHRHHLRANSLLQRLQKCLRRCVHARRYAGLAVGVQPDAVALQGLRNGKKRRDLCRLLRQFCRKNKIF